ncbi:arylesterase [Desulfohalovibrio reitneri]|uniref:arylesterase n=1 Tax=Desulfohalovibrio reitneri TaxID=1307759 RepID=UPI00068AA7F8|nr:arylesterase [Desulfohalovibrio reitneri]
MVQPASAADTCRILALGDSLTAGYGLPEKDAFPTVLQKLLREEGVPAEITNAGVSGDTSAGGRARVDWLLQGEEYDLALVALGANDALRGLSPERLRENLSAIVETLQAGGIRVVLAGMKAPRNLGPEYEQRFNAVYPDLAEKYGLALHPFLLEKVAADPALNQGDGIHPNAEGARVIANDLLPLIKREARVACGLD